MFSINKKLQYCKRAYATPNQVSVKIISQMGMGKKGMALPEGDGQKNEAVIIPMCSQYTGLPNLNP